jgi:RES domain-containing protein
MLAPARWHARPRRVVYAAGSLALAQLEKLVQYRDRSQIPRLVVGWADVPDDAALETVDLEALPAHWRRPSPLPPETQVIGDAWLARNSSLLLRVPSAVSPTDSNYLINPGHPDMARCVLARPEAFTFDVRLPGRR